jgi:transcriptional regulator with XRE-family HTH domain
MLLIWRITCGRRVAFFRLVSSFDDQHRALGQAVRERRSELGLSRAAAARQWGVSAAWLANLEQGRSNSTLDRLHALAEAMGTPLSTLFRRADSLNRETR